MSIIKSEDIPMRDALIHARSKLQNTSGRYGKTHDTNVRCFYARSKLQSTGRRELRTPFAGNTVNLE